MHNYKRKKNKKTITIEKNRGVSSARNITTTVGLLDAGNVYLDGCSLSFFITNTIFITKQLLILVITIISIRAGFCPSLSCVMIVFCCLECNDLELQNSDFHLFKRLPLHTFQPLCAKKTSWHLFYPFDFVQSLASGDGGHPT